MTANRLPASWMNALDPAAGARPSRWTAARVGAPRCPEISRRSRPASEPTVTVPSAFGRGEWPRCLRAPFARNVIPGAHAVDRARHSRCQRRSCTAGRCGATGPSRTRRRARGYPMLTELLAFLDELLSYLESVRDVHGEQGNPARRSPEIERLT